MSGPEEMEFPQPTSEHKRLEEHAGIWKVHSTFYMDPSQPPMEVEAKETIEMFGPFWTRSVYESEFMGQSYQGSATLGYDPQKKHFVSTWIDTMSPTFFQFTGSFDEAGRVLEMRGTAFDCMLKQETNYRTTEEHKSPDERVFEMFMTTPDGSEHKMMTHVYTRA